MLLLIKKKLSL